MADGGGGRRPKQDRPSDHVEDGGEVIHVFRIHSPPLPGQKKKKKNHGSGRALAARTASLPQPDARERRRERTIASSTLLSDSLLAMDVVSVIADASLRGLGR